MNNAIDRREFLTRAGLTLAVVATSSSLKVFALGPQATGSEIFSPGPWLQITPDNQVTILLCKSEMGQGIHTAIPMIVADELEADWDQVRTEMAPVEAEYADPVINQHGTFGSMSLRNMYLPLRNLGAAGREILLEAAAQKWNVPVSQCEAIQSKIHHQARGRSHRGIGAGADQGPYTLSGRWVWWARSDRGSTGSSGTLQGNWQTHQGRLDARRGY